MRKFCHWYVAVCPSEYTLMSCARYTCREFHEKFYSQGIFMALHEEALHFAPIRWCQGLCLLILVAFFVLRSFPKANKTQPVFLHMILARCTPPNPQTRRRLGQ